jgi:hypothetical protein
MSLFSAIFVLIQFVVVKGQVYKVMTDEFTFEGNMSLQLGEFFLTD